MTTTSGYDATDVEHAEYRIPLRTEIGVLPGRTLPVDKELLRSYFVRIARENCCTPRELLRFLQPTPAEYATIFPTYFGVFMDADYAEQLAQALRCTSEEIYSCLLRQDHINTHMNSHHPSILRACAECQTEDGAWRRWNGDPLYAICPIHKTLLWDLSPENRMINVKVFLRNSPITGWDSQCGFETSEKLAALQNQLVTLRKAAMESESDTSPTAMLYQIAWLYRKTLNMAAEQGGESERQTSALRKTAEEGWEELKRIEREPKPKPTTKEFQAKFSAEDIAAVLPKALKAIEAAMDGDPSYFDRMYDRLFRATNGKHAPRPTRSPTEGSATIERAA